MSDTASETIVKSELKVVHLQVTDKHIELGELGAKMITLPSGKS